jgi:glycerone phosphate O-acyltransferase/fatty acyl-CoA reductase
MKQISDYDSKVMGPLILIPTHRSYIDFLICSYVLFAYRQQCPHIATAEDFLQMAVIPTILRWSGAFFLKRKQMDESTLYRTIFYEYI